MRVRQEAGWLLGAFFDSLLITSSESQEVLWSGHGYQRPGPLQLLLEHLFGSWLAEGCGRLGSMLCCSCVRTCVLQGPPGMQLSAGVCVCSMHAFLVHLECETFDKHAQWNVCRTLSWFQIKPQMVVPVGIYPIPILAIFHLWNELKASSYNLSCQGICKSVAGSTARNEIYFFFFKKWPCSGLS